VKTTIKFTNLKSVSQLPALNFADSRFGDSILFSYTTLIWFFHWRSPCKRV